MKKSSLIKGLGFATTIGAAASSPANAQEPVRQYNILADKLKSKEVLVNWDAEKDRSYIGTGIPIMTATDTLSLPENVRGNYSLEVYFAPKGVSVEGNQLITSSDVENGIINGALVYRDPSTNEITESVRLLLPVFNGSNRERLSELEKEWVILYDKYLQEGEKRQEAEETIARLHDLYRGKMGQMRGRIRRWVDYIKEHDHEDENGNEAQFGLIMDYIAGDAGLGGIGLGVQVGPLAGLINYTEGNDNVTRDLRFPLSNGRTGYGREEEKGLRSVGFSAEIHPTDYLFLGAGVDKESYTLDIEESILAADGSVLNSNRNSKTVEGKNERFYGGVKIPLGNNLGLRVAGGHSTRGGAEVRAGIVLNPMGDKGNRTRREHRR
jgi:hypothetical protein